MITYELVQQQYRMQCDYCGDQTYVTTARSVQRAKEIGTRWAWVFGTEHGDLCQRCAQLWQVGAIQRGESAGTTRSHHRGMLRLP